jgi:hypothetical protein
MDDRQIEILSRSTPKRDYYCQSRRGNRLFELGLSEVALALDRRLAGLGGVRCFQPSLDRNRVLALASLQFIARAEAVHLIGPPERERLI